MLQTKNSTPFLIRLSLFPDERGIDAIYPAIKASFDITSPLRLAKEQLPFADSDAYAGEPNESSLVVAAETLLAKPGTDVVMIGTAYARGGIPQESIDVALSVNQRRKTIRVFGNRSWKEGFFRFYAGKPEPFVTMPLSYEFSFGGCFESSEGPIAHPWNPIGKGFCPTKRSKFYRNLELPNIESANEPLKTPGETLEPSGFGPICATWQPRLQYAGTYDEKWQRTRAPYLPDDFDMRFLQVAPPDQVFQPYLKGGETVTVMNVGPDGPLEFRLPRFEFDVTMRVDGNNSPVPVNLETVQIEPDNKRLIMIWKGKLNCDKKALKVELADFKLRSGDASVKDM